MHNEGKLVVAERFISTWNSKIYKYTTSISKNVYTDKLANIVNKYNKKKIHSTIKMMPADIKSNKYIDVDPKFNVNDHFTFCIAN